MLTLLLKYWFEWGLGVVAAALAYVYRRLSRRILDARRESEALKNGIRALLRDRIVQAYNHYMDAGCWPIYAREAVIGMFDQYRALGGNGVIGDLLDALRELPTDLPQDSYPSDGYER